MTSRPYRIAIPDAALHDLHDRLKRARWPASLDAEGWEDGAGLAFMKRLVDHWQNRYDWREQEARLNRLPNRMMTVDDQDIHFVH